MDAGDPTTIPVRADLQSLIWESYEQATACVTQFLTCAGLGVGMSLWKNAPEDKAVSQRHIKYSVSPYSPRKVIHQHL